MTSVRGARKAAEAALVPGSVPSESDTSFSGVVTGPTFPFSRVKKNPKPAVVAGGFSHRLRQLLFALPPIGRHPPDRLLRLRPAMRERCGNKERDQ